MEGYNMDTYENALNIVLLTAEKKKEDMENTNSNLESSKRYKNICELIDCIYREKSLPPEK